MQFLKLILIGLFVSIHEIKVCFIERKEGWFINVFIELIGWGWLKSRIDISHWKKCP